MWSYPQHEKSEFERGEWDSQGREKNGQTNKKVVTERSGGKRAKGSYADHWGALHGATQKKRKIETEVRSAGEERTNGLSSTRQKVRISVKGRRKVQKTEHKPKTTPPKTPPTPPPNKPHSPPPHTHPHPQKKTPPATLQKKLGPSHTRSVTEQRRRGGRKCCNERKGD